MCVMKVVTYGESLPNSAGPLGSTERFSLFQLIILFLQL